MGIDGVNSGPQSEPIDPAKSTSDFRLYKKVDTTAEGVQNKLCSDLIKFVHINY